MSIYSGFATRALENSYNRALAEALHLMQSYLAMMFKKEQQKHLKPMFSTYLVDIADVAQGFEESLVDSSLLGESLSTSFYSHDHDLQILNDGLAYDDSKVHRFLPTKLQTVLEKPAVRNLSREKTYKLTKSKNSSPEVKTMKNDVFKKVKKRMNQIKNYQNRALTRLDYEF